MSPVTSKGRFYPTPEATTRADLATAGRTTSGVSSAFNTEDAKAIEATLTIGAVSGTSPTLDVKLQTSFDGVVWDDVGVFPQKTAANAASSHTKVFGPLGPQCRYSWTVGGTATPTFNFSIATKGRNA